MSKPRPYVKNVEVVEDNTSKVGALTDLLGKQTILEFTVGPDNARPRRAARPSESGISLKKGRVWGRVIWKTL